MSIEKVCRWFAAAKLLQTGEVASTSACTHDQYSMLHSIESGPCTTWSKICQMTIVCSSLWQTSLRIPSWVYFIPYFFLERLHLFWSNKCQKIDNNMPVSTFEIVQQQLHTILFKIQIEHWIIQVNQHLLSVILRALECPCRYWRAVEAKPTRSLQGFFYRLWIVIRILSLSLFMSQKHSLDIISLNSLLHCSAVLFPRASKYRPNLTQYQCHICISHESVVCQGKFSYLCLSQYLGSLYTKDRVENLNSWFQEFDTYSRQTFIQSSNY